MDLENVSFAIITASIGYLGMLAHGRDPAYKFVRRVAYVSLSALQFTLVCWDVNFTLLNSVPHLQLPVWPFPVLALATLALYIFDVIHRTQK